MEIMHTLQPQANSYVRFTATPDPHAINAADSDLVQIYFDPKVYALLVAGCPNVKARTEQITPGLNLGFVFVGEDVRAIVGELRTYIDDFLIELGTYIIGVEETPNETFREAVQKIVNEDNEELDKDEIEGAYDEALEFLYTIEEWLERECFHGLTVEYVA